MYLFFLIFFSFVSFSLILLILFQPSQGFNNTNYKNEIKFFNNIRTSNSVINIIRMFSFLFLLISIILCNINSRKIDIDYFGENNSENIIAEKSFLNNNELNSDIPR